MPAHEQQERAFLASLAGQLEDLPAYADWLQDQDDLRGELWALWLRPRTSPETNRRYHYLLGTVGFLPSWSFASVQQTLLCYVEFRSRENLEILAWLLKELVHPCFAAIACLSSTGKVEGRRETITICWNPGGQRWCLSQPGSGRNRPGAYASPLEAAIWGLAQLPSGSVLPELVLGIPYQHVKWPGEWEHLNGKGVRRYPIH